MIRHTHFDVLVIGSGIAGLTLALRLAPFAKIGLISKVELFNSSSQYAQGGIAAVTDSKDFASHIEDTLIAGSGLCDEKVVAFTVEQAPQAIHWLIEQGVSFTRDSNNPDQFHLTREGGHSARRIYHVADSTGAAVIKTLAQRVLKQNNIHCLLDHTAIELLVTDNTCYGARILNRRLKQTEIIFAKNTVLATGGASTVYLYTSNPATSTGDGLAMAWQAGCRIANLEFNQFHPTSLYHPDANSFLISEAVRGEGGILSLPNGHRFMEQYDSRKELAPRDIVARAISFEMQKHQLDHVMLDISHKPSHEVAQLFPMILAQCKQFGFDITKQPIPIVPAAHYTCGGIITDVSARTDVENLYAIGEVACTGLHGANRMASNSLLECLVFAASASQSIIKHIKKPPLNLPNFPLPNSFYKQKQEKKITDLHEIKKLSNDLRQMMSLHLGVIRSNQLLRQAKDKIKTLIKHCNEQLKVDIYSEDFDCQQEEFYALRNRLKVAELMIESACLRQESRGCHYNIDYPGQSFNLKSTILVPDCSFDINKTHFRMNQSNFKFFR